MLTQMEAERQPGRRVVASRSTTAESCQAVTEDLANELGHSCVAGKHRGCVDPLMAKDPHDMRGEVVR